VPDVRETHLGGLRPAHRRGPARRPARAEVPVPAPKVVDRPPARSL